MSIEYIRDEVKKRIRYSSMDTMLCSPSDDEIDASIFDAIDEINMFEPQSSYTLDSIMGNVDKRWLRLLYLGASKNVVQILIFDWTANGVEVDLGDGVSSSSKLGDYNSLFSLLNDGFTTLLEKLKVSSGLRVRARCFSTGLKGSHLNRRYRSTFCKSVIR